MNEVRNGIAEATSTTVGGQLRAAREAQGLSLGDIAERTRIPTRHLTAIENDDHQGLPAATYSSGFVKTYSRLLGLDGNSLAQQFRAELNQAAPRTFHQIYEPADPARTPTKGVAWAGLLVAVVLVLGFLYWRGMRSEDPVAVASSASDLVQPAAPAGALQPAAAAGPRPAPAPSAEAPATLTADSPVWLRITDTGGKKLFEGMLDTGKSYSVPADATDPRLLTSRPNALKVMVGTTVIPTLGPPEQRIRNVSLTPASLVARATAPSPAGDPAIAAAVTPQPSALVSATPAPVQTTPN